MADSASTLCALSRRTAALTLTEFRLYAREPYTLFFALILPTVLILIFGTIYGNEPKARYGGLGTVDVSVPAYTAMILATVGLVSVPVHIASLRERGILRRLAVTPVSSLELLVAEVVTAFVLTTLGMALLVLVARLVYDLRWPDRIWPAVLVYMVSALAFFGLGFGLGFWLPSATAAQVVGMVLLYPMIFLTGAAMPRELLPERVHQIARFLPLDPVVTLLRSAWAGHALAENGRAFLGVTAVLVAGIALSAARSILPAQE